MDPMDGLSSPSRGAVHESALAPPQVFDNSDWELLPQVPVDFDGGLVASAQAALLVEPSERTTTQCGVIATWLSKVSKHHSAAIICALAPTPFHLSVPVTCPAATRLLTPVLGRCSGVEARR